MIDYYNKYFKYKTKYLELKSDNMIGGTQTRLTTENTNIIKIILNEELEKYESTLVDLTRICEPTDAFVPLINEPYDIFWLAEFKETNEIIGYLKSSDLQQYESDENFELVGGIRGKKGLQISGACNGMPDKYSNMASILLNNIEKYANENYYNYILLHAGTDRDYLISEGERKGLYIKNGFIKDRILKAGEGGFSDIDLWIMYKHINMLGGGKDNKFDFICIHMTNRRKKSQKIKIKTNTNKKRNTKKNTNTNTEKKKKKKIKK